MITHIRISCPMVLCILSKSNTDCRAAMMEFEINMSEMPLGKLSKINIRKGTGFEYRSFVICIAS